MYVSLFVCSFLYCIVSGGNRRKEMNQLKNTTGSPWVTSAISNAVFTGARLCDILRASGVNEDEIQVR